MLVIQHIWSKWTKESRGANVRKPRPRLADAYALPPIGPDQQVVRHEIRATWQEDFRLSEQLDAVDRDSWSRQLPWRETPLDFVARGEEADIILHRPSEYRQQTKWPAKLPSPLFTLRNGETAVIDWNGRFGFGSNRSSYYEQHRYWLSVTDGPHARLFLDAEPRKRIDLTTGIY